MRVLAKVMIPGWQNRSRIAKEESVRKQKFKSPRFLYAARLTAIYVSEGHLRQ
jgi:hypothetical protein